MYCVNSSGLATVHPSPRVAENNFLDYWFVREQIRLKDGYLEYDWKNPEEDHPKPKATYVSYFEPWDWVISASSYRDEFKELIKVSDFRDSILSLSFGKTGYAYVLDSKGNLIVHPTLTGNYIDAQGKDGHFFIRDILRLKNGKLVYSWKNPGEARYRDKLVLFNYIPEYDWLVACSGYLDEIYAPLKTIRNIVVLTICLILALVFITSVWINGSVILPLRYLMNRFALGASGDLAVRMPVTSTDEIGQLASFFNTFMETLEAYNANLISEIQKHKLTESALRSSEGKYRRILERIEEGYFEVDLDGIITFFNNSMVSLLGYTENELAGSDIRSYSNRSSQRIDMVFDQVRQTGAATKRSDLTFVKKDGTLCAAEASVSLIKDKHTTPTGFCAVIRDVTERKKSEKALRLSEEMFSKAFRCSPSGMFIASLKDGRVIKVNDSFLTYTGYSTGTVVGKDLMAVNFFRNKTDGPKLKKTLIRERRLKNQEVQFQMATGEKRTGLLSAEIVDLWGEACILAAMEDLTESKRLEREILTISEQERQKIAMDLHDDLCPQLIGIEVMTKILEEKLGEKSVVEASDAGKIRQFILDTITKTRQLSKGLCPVNLSDHGFDLSLEELANYVKEVFGITCVYRCQGVHHIKDSSVATQIYYIAHEAVHNAVRHSHAKTIVIDLGIGESSVTLSICDDGKGMDAVQPSRGMGLKIMSYRAESIGASFKITRNTDGGTRVQLDIGT
ncbi:MAG: cache domain-containing protein [Pseudomonadota bacterium]